MFLMIRAYFACRLFIHATFLSCAACSQREAGIYGPLTQETSARCIWDDYATLPALNQDKDEISGESTIFQIRRQKGTDLVERFWLNEEEWFQISPRSFVVFFVSCVALTSLSGGALNSVGVFASIGSNVSKNSAFYVTMAFTFVSTGHTLAGESPELMFIPLKHIFPNWKAIARAIIATMLVHAYLVFAPFSKVASFATPLACTIVAPLLLVGISRRPDSTGQQRNCESGPERKTVEVGSDELASSTDKAWTIDSTMVYSSSRIRCLDLRLLLLGLSVTLFDVLCNRFPDEMFVTRWPISAVVSISVTALWLYLVNTLPILRETESGILSLAVVALVGMFSHVNFLDAFGLYDDEWEDENLTHSLPVPEDARHLKPIMIALWYTTLSTMVVYNRQLVRQKADQTVSATNGQPPKKGPLLFGFHVKTSQINFAWQLRDSGVVICLVFSMVAACTGEIWPLDMNVTVAGLLLFTLIIGFQLRPKRDTMDEKRSVYHVAALGFSALVTIFVVGLSRHGVSMDIVSDPKNEWKIGTWSAMVFYRWFVVLSVWLEDKGWFTRRNLVEEPPTGGLRNEKKGPAEEGEKQGALGATAND